MPFAQNNHCRIYWRQDGDPRNPSLLLLHELGTDMGLWERTLPPLAERFRVIRMDIRGHGASDAPDGLYTTSEMASDARAVLDAVGLDAAFVCGAGLGAIIAIQLAAEARQRVRGLMLAPPASADARFWQQQQRLALSAGMAAVAEAALQRLLAPKFAATHPQVVGTLRTAMLTQPAAGYAACCGVMEASGITGSPRDADLPTLMLSGGGLGCLENPAATAGAIIGFVDGQLGDRRVREARQVLADAGVETLRKALGEAWLERRIANRTEFNADYQDLAARYVWQEIWSRPGLDHRTRRLLVLAITASMGRWEEFRLHLRLGLEQCSITIDEVKETLLQVAVYAGMPAANTGFAEAAAVLREREAQAKDNST